MTAVGRRCIEGRVSGDAIDLNAAQTRSACQYGFRMQPKTVKEWSILTAVAGQRMGRESRQDKCKV
jgi:hypothetical protein